MRAMDALTCVEFSIAIQRDVFGEQIDRLATSLHRPRDMSSTYCLGTI